MDLDSEGLTGVLTEQQDAWYYKRNLGDGTFGPLEQVAPKPSLAALSGGRQQLLDLAGEGHLNLVQFDGPMAGFHERNSNGDWEPFTPFKSVANINTKDPNLRFVDITGDGHPDILISEDTVFTWYESLAKDGFAPARCSPKSWDEEKGPKLVFSDPTQSIFLADMAGDGLSDRQRAGDGAGSEEHRGARGAYRLCASRAAWLADVRRAAGRGGLRAALRGAQAFGLRAAGGAFHRRARRDVSRRPHGRPHPGAAARRCTPR